jgi:hypothetical protein
MTASIREPLVKDTRRVHMVYRGSARPPRTRLLQLGSPPPAQVDETVEGQVFARGRTMAQHQRSHMR